MIDIAECRRLIEEGTKGEMSAELPKALDEIERLRADVTSLRGVISDVNDATHRAGIYCAITFAEAIDQIRTERDALRRQLDAEGRAK